MEGISLQKLMENPVYVVSINKDIIRYANCKPELAKVGFKDIRRYMGLDGHKHAWEDENDGYLRHKPDSWAKSKTYKLACDTLKEEGLVWSKPWTKGLLEKQVEFSGGQFGCAISHYRCIKEAYDRGDEYVWILEDDAKPHQCFTKVAHELWENTPKDFDIVYFNLSTDHSDVHQRNGSGKVVYNSKIDDRCRILKMASFGQQCYIVSRKGMRKYLDYVKNNGLYVIDIDLVMMTDRGLITCYEYHTSEHCDYDCMPGWRYSLVGQMNGNYGNDLKIPLSIHCHQKRSPFVELQGWCCPEKEVDLFHYIDLYNCKKGLEIGVFGGSSFLRAGMMFKANGGKITGIDPYCAEDSNKYDEEGANKDWWRNINYEMIKVGCLNAIQTFGLKRCLCYISNYQ